MVPLKSTLFVLKMNIVINDSEVIREGEIVHEPTTLTSILTLLSSINSNREVFPLQTYPPVAPVGVVPVLTIPHKTFEKVCVGVRTSLDYATTLVPL